MTNLYGDLRPDATDLPNPRRALAIGAHPDDAEFGAGGTLIRWGRSGTVVSLLVMTDGSKGSWDPSADPAELAAVRHAETLQAAEVLGCEDVEFFGAVDGELRATPAAVERVSRHIRRRRPDVVLTHDPWQRYQLHPDHRATGWIVVDAVVSARDPHFFPHQIAEGLLPHRPSALLLWSADEPDHWEPIDVTLEQKIDALLCHSSQSATTMGDAHLGGPARAAFEGRMTAWAARQGEAAGLAAAESFRRLTP